MSLESNIIAGHLNAIQAGRAAPVGIDLNTENKSAKFFADKTSVALICMGLGLSKLAEYCLSADRLDGVQ